MGGPSALEELRSAEIPAKERLDSFAEHFDTFEVDSTYYRLPSESMVEGWAERTPDVFNRSRVRPERYARLPSQGGVSALRGWRPRARAAGLPKTGPWTRGLRSAGQLARRGERQLRLRWWRRQPSPGPSVA